MRFMSLCAEFFCILSKKLLDLVEKGWNLFDYSVYYVI